METINYYGIDVIKDEAITMEEVKAYHEHLMKKHPKRKFISITMKIDPEDPSMVNMDYKMRPINFERIRRITGYLVGTMENWNDSKTAEEKDRIKHGTEDSGFEQL